MEGSGAFRVRRYAQEQSCRPAGRSWPWSSQSSTCADGGGQVSTQVSKCKPHAGASIGQCWPKHTRLAAAYACQAYALVAAALTRRPLHATQPVPSAHLLRPGAVGQQVGAVACKHVAQHVAHGGQDGHKPAQWEEYRCSLVCSLVCQASCQAGDMHPGAAAARTGAATPLHVWCTAAWPCH